MTKSDDGEKSCPLCTEEMDLTDQQLKPCKCGYEICVWCWHHITEMAEKDGNVGRCPACRSAYDKERIACTAAKCERLVAEANADRRMKSQRGKLKISAEMRKQLADVRVIQRNLVYIIGMPPAVADSHILERKEYFGQYGKIVKISISRPSSGMQQSTNSNAVGLYITYTREEEAVRCIQAVHNFVLEGKPLRACFGTTKYCHSWIRNMACSNPDCYYLHEICSQEDSFSKNEIISAYPRLPQVASSNSRSRSGNLLPPPADAFCMSDNVSSSNIIPKGSTNHFASHSKGSPPKGSGTARFSGLPLATTWGSRPSGSTSAKLSCLQGPRDLKQEAICTKQSSLEDGMVKLGKILPEAHERLEDGIHRVSESFKTASCGNDLVAETSSASVAVGLSPARHDSGAATSLDTAEDSGTAKSNASSESYNGDIDGTLHPGAVDHLDDKDTTQQITSAWDDDDDIFAHNSPMDSSAGCKSSMTSMLGCVQEHVSQLSDGTLGNVFDKDATMDSHARSLQIPSYSGNTENASAPGNIANPACGAFPEEIHIISSTSNVRGHDCSITSNNLADTCSRMALVQVDDSSMGGCGDLNMTQYHDPVVGRVGISTDSNLELQPSRCQTDHVDLAPTSRASTFSEDISVSGNAFDLLTGLEKQALPFLDSETKDTLEASRDSIEDHSDLFLNSAPDQASGSLSLIPDACNANYSSHICNNEYRGNCLSAGSLRIANIDSSEAFDVLKHREFLLPNSISGSKFDSRHNHGNSNNKYSGAMSAYTGNDGEDTIISNLLSMDFDPLSANNSFIELLRETGGPCTHFNTSCSPKPQSNDQSRFSFARQEQPPSFDKLPCKSSILGDASVDSLHHASAASIFPQSVATLSNHSSIQSDRTPVPSRAKISAPPGFSAQCRAPPPGFSQNINNKVYSQGSADLIAGSSSGHQIQLPHAINSCDVEFIDPAILAVVRGSSPASTTEFSLESFPSYQNSTPEMNSRVQFLVNQPTPPNQTRGVSDHGDNFLNLYGHPPTWYADQNFSSPSPRIPRFLPSEDSSMSNNMWDHYGTQQFKNDLAIAELLRKGFVLNNGLPCGENHKSHTVDPNTLYGRAFGL